MTNKEPTLGEFQIKFEAHELRDVDRYDMTIGKMDTGFKNVIDKIEELKSDVTIQVNKHEVRLGAHDSEIGNLQGWKQWMNGGMAAFALVLVPVFSWMLYKIITLDASIQTAVIREISSIIKP